MTDNQHLTRETPETPAPEDVQMSLWCLLGLASTKTHDHSKLQAVSTIQKTLKTITFHKGLFTFKNSFTYSFLP